jgi:hypothetical protein
LRSRERSRSRTASPGASLLPADSMGSF